MRALYDRLKSIPWLRRAVETARGTGVSPINVIKTFPSYAPFSGGTYAMLAPLTVRNINQLGPALSRLHAAGHGATPVISIDAFVARHGTGDADRLAALLQQHGSDKAGNHDYFRVYAAILGDGTGVRKLMEVGLGTNNVDVASSMGRWGRPGASLRAFRDFLPGAQIHGADIDRRILFEEERIATHFIDQTDPEVIEALAPVIGDGFDLMIDDGLHALNANLHMLAFFVGRLRPGGWAVIEDIHPNTLAFWKVVPALLPPGTECALIETRAACMFACRLPAQREASRVPAMAQRTNGV